MTIETTRTRLSSRTRAIAAGLLAFASATAAVAAPIEIKASTGVYTLQPKQLLRLHLVDVGDGGVPLPTTVEVRDDAGRLLVPIRIVTVDPKHPLNLTYRAESLIGTRRTGTVRVVVTVQGESTNPRNAPIFTMEVQRDPASTNAGPTDLTPAAKCPMIQRGDPPPTLDPVTYIKNDCFVEIRFVAP